MPKGEIELKNISVTDDKDAINTLLTNTMGASYDEAFYRANTKSGLSKKAYYNGQLVGVVLCKNEAKRRALYVSAIATSQQYQRAGMGAILMQFIKEKYKSGHFDYVELHVEEDNVGAIRFYENHGFKEYDRDDHYYRDRGAACKTALIYRYSKK